MKKVLLILICFFHINLYAEENKKVILLAAAFGAWKSHLIKLMVLFQ